MSATIITKNSSTASAVPAAGSLVQGELAVNVTDKKLYTKDSSGTVQKLVGSLGNQEASAVAITGGTESGVAITGGPINNTPIGVTTASTVRGTTVTATTGFVGDLTGNVTGNTTGTHTGAVTGNVTGDLTGNVTASSGTSSFNNVTINGTLDMNSGSAGTITGLATPSASSDAANKGYVDTAISNLIGTAPSTLDTLGEIADALNDDANIAATLTAQIAAKVSKSGDSMTGALAMGSNKITGLGTPTASTDAATKGYVDTADATKLNLSGGTMTGNIVMGANKVTSTATPTTDDDLTRKAYVDSILGSATSAATSASAAATSATNAANSASAASSSASDASASASAAAASYDSFDDRYLGAKASAPTVDNDGNSLLTGAIYWNSTSNTMWVWNGSAWVQATLTAGSFVTLAGTETLTNKTISGSNNTITNVSLSTGVTGTLPVANGGTGATTLTGILKGNGTSAFTAATAGTDYVAPGIATTFTAQQNFTGSTTVTAAKLTNAVETINSGNVSATGTINFDVTTSAVLYYYGNATGNWTVNFRGNTFTSLNTLLASGESLTAAFLVQQGATAYYNNAVTIDGTSVTPKWQGGTAPTAGNANSIDVYTYTIIKTNPATFTVLAAQTKFA